MADKSRLDERARQLLLEAELRIENAWDEVRKFPIRVAAAAEIAKALSNAEFEITVATNLICQNASGLENDNPT